MQKMWRNLLVTLPLVKDLISILLFVITFTLSTFRVFDLPVAEEKI